MIGRTLEHYRIEAKLGEGGMGLVYKAHDTHLDRPVSIKVLLPGCVADPERKRRFVQEAKAASALNHPNILHVYDIDAADGMDFIAMEFVDGKTLDELITRKGLKLSQALKYAVQIADGLSAAHATGIVHRDIKPSNLMVNREGLVKILDFGVAKLSEQVEDDPSASTQTTRPRTEEGAIVGTVAYMSPEQAEGRKVDARSDIFSFGSVLYEMVTGRRAFQGDTKISTLSDILHKEPPPITQISENTPPELERIIVRCMRKDPARRTQHIVDVRLALEELKEASESGPQAVSLVARAPSWRRWALAASVAVVPVTGFFAWQAWRGTQPEEPLRAVALTTFPGIESYPSLSPDGNNVAFMWTGHKQDNPDIYVQMIGAGSPLRLTTDPRSDYNPVWSPDGRSVAFLRAEQLPPPSGPAGKSEVWLVPPLGGPERKMAEIEVRIVGDPGFLAWSPDSTSLVVTDSQGEGKADALFAVSLDTGEKRQLTSPPPPSLGDSNPAVSPDGRWLVFRRVPAAGAGELYRLPLGRGLIAVGEPQRLTLAALDAAYPAWMPDGKEILFSTRRLAGGLWRLAISGEKTPARLPFVGENGLMPAVSRSQPGRAARLVYARSFTDANIWRVDTSASGAAALSPPVIAISSTQADIVGDFSPDGRRVAFASTRSGDPNVQVWLADRDGSNAVQLTSTSSGLAAAPRWSPDGQLITFQSNLEGQFEIYVIPAAGGKPRRITSHPANDHVPSFSRDGRWIYFSSTRTGDYQIWKVPAAGGEAAQVTHRGGFSAFEGTDGTDLYYTQTPGGISTTLWRMPSSGGRPIKLLEGVISSAFAVLKRGIYYIDRPGDQARLQFFDFVTGRSTTVARNLGDVRPLLTASADGRTILYTREDSSVGDLMLVEHFR